MSPKAQKEEIYTRHASSRLSEMARSLADIMNPEGKAEVMDDLLVLDASHGNFA
jgi:hypothetical protein